MIQTTTPCTACAVNPNTVQKENGQGVGLWPVVGIGQWLGKLWA